jgi:hypothetical protein
MINTTRGYKIDIIHVILSSIFKIKPIPKKSTKNSNIDMNKTAICTRQHPHRTKKSVLNILIYVNISNYLFYSNFSYLLIFSAPLIAMRASIVSAAIDFHSNDCTKNRTAYTPFCRYNTLFYLCTMVPTSCHLLDRLLTVP